GTGRRRRRRRSSAWRGLLGGLRAVDYDGRHRGWSMTSIIVKPGLKEVGRCGGPRSARTDGRERRRPPGPTRPPGDLLFGGAGSLRRAAGLGLPSFPDRQGRDDRGGARRGRGIG